MHLHSLLRRFCGPQNCPLPAVSMAMLTLNINFHQKGTDHGWGAKYFPGHWDAGTARIEYIAKLQPYTIGIERTAYIYGYSKLVYIYHIYTVIWLEYRVVTIVRVCHAFSSSQWWLGLEQAAPIHTFENRASIIVFAFSELHKSGKMC
jgi:hypothetical protein